MWGATDIAYVLWLSLRAPIVPFWSRVRLVITVFDVHVNASMSSFYSTLGFLVLQVSGSGSGASARERECRRAESDARVLVAVAAR